MYSYMLLVCVHSFSVLAMIKCTEHILGICMYCKHAYYNVCVPSCCWLNAQT
jgi:hypothetical protein